MVLFKRRQSNLRVNLLLSASALTIGVAPAARSQTIAMPTIVSPLKVQEDINGVNMTNGRARANLPTLSVPAAPRLKFDYISNAMPYLVAKIGGGQGSYIESAVAVHYGQLEAETFRCLYDDVCTSQKLSGASIGGDPVNGTYYDVTQAKTGAVYNFDNLSYNDVNTRPNGTAILYASSASYPDGEVISYTYDTAVSGTRKYYRVTKMSSNLGYHLSFSYLDNNFPSNFWGVITQATLYNSANPSTPLGQLTYSSAGAGTVTDLKGRVYQCNDCQNRVDAPVETAASSVTLPGESNAAEIITSNGSVISPVVTSVARDGVTWSYTYANLQQRSSSLDVTYDQVAVSGPSGYHQTYVMATGRADRPNLVASVTDSLNRTTSYSYDGYYRPIQVTYPEGNVAKITYDYSGNITSKVSQPKSGSNLSAITESAAYNTSACGQRSVLCFRPTSSTDGLGRQTDYSYDGAGRLTQRTDPADASGVRRVTYISYGSSFTAPTLVRTCGLGSTCGTGAEIRTEYTYVGSTALPATETRVDGTTGTSLTTTYSYDSAGRLLMQDGPLAGSDDAIYNRYDILGRKTWEIGPKGITNGVRQAKRYTYRDSDDKVVAVEMGYVSDPNSTTLNVLKRADTSYDSRRNPVREAVSSGGTIYTVTDASFDDRGQQLCSTVRMNAAAFGSLPGDACTLGTEGSDGPDRVTRNSYDAGGQLLVVQKAYGTSLQQDYATYSYTANGKRASVKDANGNLATMGYDGFDRQVSWNFPSASSMGQVSTTDYEAYGYDAAGNRTSLRKRDGRTIAYGYDGLNRVTSKTYPQGGARGVYYSYDVRGLQTAARFDGPGGGDAVTASWDGFGRQTASTTAMGGVSRTLTYGYDANGARTRVTYPDGQYVDYNREATGKLYYGALNGGGPLFHPTYYTNDLPSVLYRWVGGGWSVPTAYSYDPIGRLNGLSYDLAGSVGDVSSTFAYNAASQLGTRTRSNDAYAFTGYVTADRGYAVNGLNQYTSAGSASFSYDANGNLTGDGTTGYGYDIENRLVSASNGLQLTWDPLGRLYQTSGTGSGTTQFLYDGDALVADYDGSGGMKNRYVHSDAADDPLVWYEGAGTGSPRHLYADHQGSIVAVADAGGNLVATNGYDEYGITKNSTGALAPYGRFGFTGQAWLPELGMYHYKARIYSPTLGRFLQTDPIGYDDQVNLYAYVANDPVNGRDPSGTQSVLDGVVDWGKMVASDIVELGKGLAHGDFGWALGGLPPTLGGGAGGMASASLRVASAEVRAEAQVARAVAVSPQARGVASEARVLRSMGLTKNTQAVATREGRAIPDALTSRASVEIKDTARVSATSQVRIQTDAAAASGRQSVLVTGTNTQVTAPAARRFDQIIRRDDLGPR